VTYAVLTEGIVVATFFKRTLILHTAVIEKAMRILTGSLSSLVSVWSSLFQF